jgi:LPXTG-motif cell wall-anchored protein
MSGTAVITTRTKSTPVTVTEVKNGQVVEAAGGAIYVKLPDGQVKAFTQGEIDKRGIKIVRDGKPAQLSEFHKGDQLSATIITSGPPKTVSEKEVQATLAKAAPPAAAAPTPAPSKAPPAAQGLAGPETQAPAPPAAASAPQEARTLPKTAGAQPMIALVGFASMLLGATLTITRRRSR